MTSIKEAAILSIIKYELELGGLSTDLINLAVYAVKACERESLPDWVVALANVNPLNVAAGIDEVRRHMHAEEKEDDN